MNALFNYIKRNKLVKLASLNSISIVIKLVTGVLTSKALAIFVGPEGLALFGNIRNFLSAIQSIATLGITSGVVKYVSEFKYKVFRLSKTLSSVTSLIVVSTILTALGCFFLAEDLSAFVFDGKRHYSYVFKLISVALPFYVLHSVSISIINGFSQYKTVLKINIIGQVLSTVFTLFLIWYKQLSGALIALATSQALILVVSLFWIFSGRQLFKLIKFKKIGLRTVKDLGLFSIMTLFTAITSPLISIEIRSHIIDVVNIEAAGFWEAMVRISNYYFVFVSSLLALYLLPRYSEIDTDRAFRNEVLSFYKTIVPIFLIGLTLLYFMRSFVVKLLFSEEFLPVEDLFFWQQLGDVFKVLALVISFQLIAKRMFWHYIITEIVSLGILYFTSLYFIDAFGVKGATIAHFITFVIYYVVILTVFRKPLFGQLVKTKS